MKISESKANDTLDAIKAQFKEYCTDLVLDDGYVIKAGEQPTLVERDDCWEIVWECNGPDEWAYRAFEGGIDEEATSLLRQEFPESKQVFTTKAVQCPEGVFAEPIYSFSLGLYPVS